ncbi:MAG TPA: hypothetical protein VIH79_02690 [Candidatus Nanopelagicaceae bacterium]
MKINMFEGARRITKLIAVIWVVGWCINMFTSRPYIQAYFRIDSPSSVPIRMGVQENGCDGDDASEYLYGKYTSKGTEINATLCFKPMTFDNGKILIPYRVDKATSMVWGGEKYSTDVSNYTKAVANSFYLSKADEEWADSGVWPARWKNIKQDTLVMVGGLAFLWIFSWCVGWVVRGFAGIPLGQDRKPDDKQISD